MANTVKPVMAEHDVYGIWYFTSITECARFIEVYPTNLVAAIRNNRSYKNWKIDYIDNLDDVCRDYINPADKGITMKVFEERTKELLKQAVNNYRG